MSRERSSRRSKSEPKQRTRKIPIRTNSPIRLTDKQVNELCDYVEGSTSGLGDGLVAIGLDHNQVDDLDSHSLFEIDQKVFWCDNCGWCCSADERSDSDDGEICNECNEEED
jgi:hypothetical protein